MARRHLIIGGGTAGMNAMRTIREEERERSDITLVSAEKPYSRMVLPYYLDRSIAESHVYTAAAAQLAAWGVTTHLGRRVTALDVKTNRATLDDGTTLEYDDCLIATGSAAVRAPVPGADVVIMATGIKTNLDWLKGSGVVIDRGVVVDEHLRSNVTNVYAAGDVAEGRDLISGEAAVHAIEPTAQEHGRVVGANMAGKDVRYRGSLIINIVEVCHLDVASFGAWDDPKAEAVSGLKRERTAYRKLLFTGDRLTGAIILGPSADIWTTNDVGMLKGLVQSGVSLARFKGHLKKNPFDVKPAFIASKTTGRLLPETVLGRPSKAPGDTPVAV